MKGHNLRFIIKETQELKGEEQNSDWENRQRKREDIIEIAKSMILTDQLEVETSKKQGI